MQLMQQHSSQACTQMITMPLQASFGFVDDMRRKSSGAASASLMLSHWERLQVQLSHYIGQIPIPQLLKQITLPCSWHYSCSAMSLGSATGTPAG